MHICYLGDSTSIHVIKWAQYFIDRGYKLSIITDVPNLIKGVDVYDIGECVPSVHIKYLSGIFQIIKKRSLIKQLLFDELKPDIIHAHYATDYGFLAAITGYHPFVLTVHGSDCLIDIYKDNISRAFVNYSVKKADIITAPSKFMTKVVDRIAYGKTETIQYGVDIGKFKIEESSSTSKFKTIISTRMLTDKYEVDTLIKALPLLTEKCPDLKCIVAGSGNNEIKFIKYLKDNGCSKNVQFVGNVENSKMPELLNEASIYISTSPSDGISISLLEAMSCGLFPVVTDILGNREVIADNKNGLLFKPGDVSGLVNCIVKAFKDDELMRDSVFINKKIIKERFSFKKNLSFVNEIYKSLVK